MRVSLVVMEGNRAGTRVPVVGAKFFIGRSEECHLRPASDKISRHHCALLIENALVSVRDFGSRNGTFVNGERVTGECQLQSGDLLRVGPLTFEVELVQSLGGPVRPKVRDVKEAASRAASSLPQNDEDSAISDWLNEDEDVLLSNESNQSRHLDTTRVVKSDLESLSNKPDRDDAENEPSEDEGSQASASELLRERNKTPGKVPEEVRQAATKSKQTTKDTHEAAEKALSKISRKKLNRFRRKEDPNES